MSGTTQIRTIWALLVCTGAILLVSEAASQDGSQAERSFGDIGQATGAIQLRYGIPIGIEIMTDGGNDVPIVLDLSKRDPKRVLAALVLQRPAYEWFVEDGVYQVRPRAAADVVTNVMIRTYSITDASREEASLAISALPEFRKWLSERGMTRRELETRFGRDSVKISVKLKNVSIRKILNRLTKESGGSQWTVIRYGPNGEYLGVYF